MRRQALEEELERLAPPFDPQLDKAAEILRDFGRFWQVERSAVERHKLLATLFDRVWQEAGRVVAVKPQQAFAGYFIAATQMVESRPKKRGDDIARSSRLWSCRGFLLIAAVRSTGWALGDHALVWF
jgi:hypothetical protein